MVTSIPIKGGYSPQSIIVDDRDANIVRKHVWFAHWSTNTYYARRRLQTEEGKNKYIFLHNQLMQPPKGKYVDHADRNGLNCTRENMRIATKGQNAHNTLYKNRTGYRGVEKLKTCYRATIMVSGYKQFLGTFATDVEAAQAYDDACKASYGEFAVLNFPN